MTDLNVLFTYVAETLRKLLFGTGLFEKLQTTMINGPNGEKTDHDHVVKSETVVFVC